MRTKLLMILIFNIFIFTGCNEKVTNAQEITIGAILPLTGNASKIGQWQKKGIELAVNQINKNDLVKVKVIFEDSMSNPKNGILAYKNLILNPNIDTIITSLTSVSLAIQSSAEKDKKSLIMLAVSDPFIANKKKYTIRFNLGSEDESLKLAEYLKRQNYQSICVAYINNDFGLMATKVLEENTKNIIFKNGYSPQSTDFRTLSEKIIANKCDALSVIGYTNASILLIKQLKESGGMQDIFTNMALSIPSFQKLGGESLRGVKYTATTFGTNTSSKSSDFITQYREYYNEKPTFFASFAYDALNFIYKNKNENIPLMTNQDYDYNGSIGNINIKQGNLKTDVSIYSF